MPLDNSLNNDIQASLSLHCAITAYLRDDDPSKFSFATPLTIVSGINRIYGNDTGNVPSSKRIMQDTKKALNAFGAVYEHGGQMVPGLANRNGHRNLASGRNTEGWGGVRVKSLLVDEVGRWLHEDAVSAKIVELLKFLHRLLERKTVRVVKKVVRKVVMTSNISWYSSYDTLN